jgi:hypothetical protein
VLDFDITGSESQSRSPNAAAPKNSYPTTAKPGTEAKSSILGSCLERAGPKTRIEWIEVLGKESAETCVEGKEEARTDTVGAKESHPENAGTNSGPEYY